jgi:hypothetical protein
MRSFENRFTQLIANNNTLRQSTTVLNTNFHELLEINRNMLNGIQTLSQDNQGLRQDNQEIKQHNQNLTHQIAEQDKKINKLSQDNQDLKKDNQDLKKDNQEMKMMLMQLLEGQKKEQEKNKTKMGLF